MQNISVDEDPAGDRQVERACKEEENRPGAGREREGEREGERESEYGAHPSPISLARRLPD